MSYSFKTTVQRASDLASVLNSFTPAEAAKLDGTDALKNIKMCDKLVDELQKPCTAFLEATDKLNAATRSVAVEAKKEIDALTETDESKLKALQQAIVDKANAEVQKVSAEFEEKEGLKKMGEEEVTVQIVSNDRYTFLKSILPKVVDRYTQRKALIETVEAVEGSKED